MIRAAVTIRALKKDSGNTPAFGVSEDGTDNRNCHLLSRPANARPIAQLLSILTDEKRTCMQLQRSHQIQRENTAAFS
jgi:hypothetical protein